MSLLCSWTTHYIACAENFILGPCTAKTRILIVQSHLWLLPEVTGCFAQPVWCIKCHCTSSLSMTRGTWRKVALLHFDQTGPCIWRDPAQGQWAVYLQPWMTPCYVADAQAWNLPWQDFTRRAWWVEHWRLLLGVIGLTLVPSISSWWWCHYQLPCHCCLSWWVGVPCGGVPCTILFSNGFCSS